MGHYLWGLSERRELSGCCAPPCLCIFGPGHSYSRLTLVLGSNFQGKKTLPPPSGQILVFFVFCPPVLFQSW